MKIALAILAFVFVIYADTFNHPYFFDDIHYIQNNIAIQSSANLLRLWTSAKYNSVSPEQWGYRPFTTFMHSLSWSVGNGATWPFHVLKWILHSIVCLFLLQIWKRLWTNQGFFPETPPQIRFKWAEREIIWTITPTYAAVALAFVFAAHPVNTQVLNYITATTTLLAGTCYIAAYYFYLRYREETDWKFLLGSLGLYIMAVLAKEEGITLCGVVLLTELILPRRGKRTGMLIGYFLTALILALLLRAMFAESSNLARGNATRIEYFMTQWRAYLRYIRLLLLPIGLNADNIEFGFSKSFLDLKVLFALCGNLILLTLAWLNRRRYPIFLFSLLWFYIAVSPASSVIPLAEPVNDHRMYLAYFGLVGIFPWLLKIFESVFRSRKTKLLSPASGAIALLAFLALIIGTEIRNRAWSSQNTLWGDTVKKNPHSPRALNNLALAFLEQEEWDRSRELLDRCEKISPEYVVCKVNKGMLLMAIGHDEEADQKFREAIAIAPHLPEPKSFYASFLMQRGRHEPALHLFREIDQITFGQDLTAKLGWAKAAQLLGRPVEAKSVLQDALKQFGKRPEIMVLLAEGSK